MAALKSDTRVELSFRGRFSFGIDQWAYVPFEVPSGTQRIDVSTSHDQFSLLGIGRNVLDLGIFGPAGHELGNAAGFRGWSGGARAGFMLSAVNATPGYLAGPIDQGRWALALGPVVLNPMGMDWQAQITLTRGVQPSLRPVPDYRHAVRPVSQPGWYRGDLHTHTVHSDGRRRITEMAAAATSAGLDFIVSTDHNTNSANRAWAAPRTTAWRSSQVRRSPPATGIGWRSRCLLAAGLTGGTHRAMASSPPTPRGCGRTAASWWAAATLTRRVNRSGGRRQSRTRRTLRRRTSSRDDGTATAGPGETLTVRPGAAVTVTARVSGAPDASVALVTEGGCMGRAKIDASGDGELTWTSFGGQARFARVEVRRRARSPSMVALSNPVWLQSL